MSDVHLGMTIGQLGAAREERIKQIDAAAGRITDTAKALLRLAVKATGVRLHFDPEEIGNALDPDEAAMNMALRHIKRCGLKEERES